MATQPLLYHCPLSREVSNGYKTLVGYVAYWLLFAWQSLVQQGLALLGKISPHHL